MDMETAMHLQYLLELDEDMRSGSGIGMESVIHGEPRPINKNRRETEEKEEPMKHVKRCQLLGPACAMGRLMHRLLQAQVGKPRRSTKEGRVLRTRHGRNDLKSNPSPLSYCSSSSPTLSLPLCTLLLYPLLISDLPLPEVLYPCYLIRVICE
jgi:hypothetical protein